MHQKVLWIKKKNKKNLQILISECYCCYHITFVSRKNCIVECLKIRFKRFQGAITIVDPTDPNKFLIYIINYAECNLLKKKMA